MSEDEKPPDADAVAKMLADTMPLPEPGTDPLAYRAQMFLYKHLRYDPETQKLALTVAFNDLLVGFAREEGAAAATPPERAQLPTRPYPDDATADPIFLLQSKRWYCNNVDKYTYHSDEEVLRDSDGEKVDSEYMEGSEDFDTYWEIEGVFLTRSAANEFGETHHYRYQYGFRSYSVHAVGDLATLLKAITDA